MGWSYSYNATRKSIIEEILLDVKNNTQLKILDTACTSYGKRLWILIEHKSLSSPLVILYLLDKSNGNWGYKDISEDMHPYYYDCPLRLINRGGGHNEQSMKWRDQVRQYHNNRKKWRDQVRVVSQQSKETS